MKKEEKIALSALQKTNSESVRWGKVVIEANSPFSAGYGTTQGMANGYRFFILKERSADDSFNFIISQNGAYISSITSAEMTNPLTLSALYRAAGGERPPVIDPSQFKVE